MKIFERHGTVAFSVLVHLTAVKEPGIRDGDTKEVVHDANVPLGTAAVDSVQGKKHVS